MDEARWHELEAAVRQVDDVERYVEAARQLEDESTIEDVPRLRGLLEDPSFAVREAAAFPLAYLLGPACLRDLLVAQIKGEREGHDNDTLNAAIGEVLSLDESGSSAVLSELKRDADPILVAAAASCEEYWDQG
jgi:hypothetical protein